MTHPVYRLNRAVNKPVEFRGLESQYILYLGAGLILILLVFVILFVCGINGWICTAFPFVTGAILFFVVYRLNHRYGQFGLMKKRASRRLPRTIRTGTRKMFYGNFSKNG
ncbi:MAG TPA: DUF4133 domain-containing protein [Chitinophagaceae bacterium]|nr:DUF4133 domain-containing protein [Chitinophagaceae bacterium]